MASIEETNNKPSAHAENADTDSSSESDDPEIFDDCDSVELEDQRLNRIPYLSVYDDLKELRRRGYFIPGVKVTAKIVHAERDTHGMVHPVNRYVYTIDLKHGKQEWTIQRRYGDFFQLNQRLKLFRAGAKIKSPFQKLSRRVRHTDEGPLHTLSYTDGGDLIEIKSVNQPAVYPSTNGSPGEVQIRLSDLEKWDAVPGFDPNIDDLEFADAEKTDAEVENTDEPGTPKKKRHAKLVDFPTKPDSFVNEEHLEERKTRLENWLTSLLHIHAYRNHHETAQFLAVSRLSFVHNLGCKHCEGFIKQRPGGEYAMHRIRNFCLMHCCKWRKRWLAIKDSFVASLHDDEETVYDVVLYDSDFRVVTNTLSGPDSAAKGLTISNLQRDLLIKCKSAEEATAWMQEILRVSREKGQLWLESHRFGSTFPPREDNFAHWFVDGRSFMSHCANMLEIAKEEIFITDWWLNPHIYLKRPMKDDHWRLDMILKRKAEAGIRIFVQVYKEVTMALALNSYFTEQYLTSLHENIRVMRHPDHLPGGIFSWAHHEKVVVVDQKIAFIGGIDLCYGRWDDHEHKLTDLGTDDVKMHWTEAAEQTDAVEEIRRRYHSQDSHPESLPESPPQPESDPFLPQPAAAEKSKKVTFNGVDSTENADGETEKVATAPLLSSTPNLAEIFKTKYKRMEEDEKNRRWKTAFRGLKAPIPLVGANKLWPGKDYVNFIHKDIPEPEKPFEDFVDRTVIPRLPWHDISSVVYGSAARDVARHFIQRWNSTKLDSLTVNQAYPLLVPKSYDNVGVPEVFRKMSSPCKVQILRSCCIWSAGINAVETGIHQAYLAMITEAEHYIYIENQFFISQMGGSDVNNQIATALFDRIVRAHRQKKTFRVYVVMPLLPAFEKQSGSLQVVLHWTYVSIAKGARSLLWRLQKEIGDPSEYITFCSLRTHTKLVDKLVTELIYIHSKLIIVDDRFCLIGSANINDRSQLGSRDSEVALFVEDTQFTPSKMNGLEFESGSFAGGIRRHLFREHLGLLGKNADKESEIDIEDPAASEFYHLWRSIALKNTQIFEKVFECAPSDRIRTLEQFAQSEEGKITLSDRDPTAASKILSGVQGHLVEFPTQFLIDSELTPSILTTEGFMPTYIFV